MPPQRTATPILILIPENIPRIFEQAQITTANHQKNFVALNKLHSAAITASEPTRNGISDQSSGEKAFEDVFIEMITRLLPLKKGASVVDRVVKFIAGYIKFLHEKESQNTGPRNDLDDDTPAYRFLFRLASFLLKGFEAKDKTVRYRVVQIITEIIKSLSAIDEEIYKMLHSALIARAHDKEPVIRAQAIIALGKSLSPNIGADDQEETIEILLDTLVHDTAVEVRKAALLHIPITSATLPAVISRSRDVDPGVRKLAYSPVLEQLESPKQLTIAQREFLVKAGLKDREETVVASASKLVSSWANENGDILEFIGLFDLDAEKGNFDDPAHLALISLFKSRKDIFDNLEFGDGFWSDLTPAKGFLARTYVDFCVSTKDESRIEANMPVMTALAFRIQSLYNELMNQIQAEEEVKAFENTETNSEDANPELSDRQFILGELMQIAVHLDFADEIGRRKISALITNLLSQETLPDPLVPRCLDILCRLNRDEKDLIRIVVEIIHELRDSDSDDDDMRARSLDPNIDIEDTPMPLRTPGRPRKPPTEMTPEERERANLIDVRCLTLCVGMLERVESSFESNSTLEGVLGELILPSIKSSDLNVRKLGLTALGLCCLIAWHMAKNSFPLFVNEVLLPGTPEPHKTQALQVVFDLILAYGGDLLLDHSRGGDKVVGYLLRQFELCESPERQAFYCKGLAKLMLHNLVEDESVLKSLVIAYVSPDFAENQEVRQSLSYFLPVFCFSSSKNQRLMQRIFLSVYEELSQIHIELEAGEGMISPLQIGSLLVDWTDPQKIAKISGLDIDENTHFDLALDIIKWLANKDIRKEDKKVLCQLLNKLYLPETIDDDKIRTLKLLVNGVRTRRPPKDTASSNALVRFDIALSKKYEKQLADFSEESFRKLEELKELFEFLDDIIPEVDEEEEKPKRSSRKRRSESIISTSSATSVENESKSKPRSKGKGRAKKRRISNSDSDSDEAGPSAPTRTLPSRSARRAPIVIAPLPSSDEEEEEPEPSEAETEAETESEPEPELEPEEQTPLAPSKSLKSLSRRRSRRYESMGRDEPDETIVELDSIMDTLANVDDAEEDDDEVDNLLDAL